MRCDRGESVSLGHCEQRERVRARIRRGMCHRTCMIWHLDSIDGGQEGNRGMPCSGGKDIRRGHGAQLVGVGDLITGTHDVVERIDVVDEISGLLG